ncbi:MAG: hypothetical protein ACTS3T_02610 [Almyronema sp.]
MPLPLVVPESQLQVFNFYSQKHAYRAALFGNLVYKFMNTFALAQQEEAFQFSRQLAAQGYATLMSVAADTYRIWVDVCLADSDPKEPELTSPHAVPAPSRCELV